MSIFTHLTNADTVLELFESVDTGILVVDGDGRVAMTNKSLREMLGHTPDCLGSDIRCYKLLRDRNEVCPDCPVFIDEQNLGAHKSLVIKNEIRGDIYVRIYFSTWMDHIVLTFHDVTREVALLREIDLGRKELQAKNILLERRKNETAMERQLLEKLWDNMPEALVTVDETFHIKRKNAEMSRLLTGSEGSEKCYELVGNEYVCEGCPVNPEFDFEGTRKKSHKIGDTYYTETIMKSPVGKGGLLQFRNTTRQIELIEKIRDQQDAIQRKNDILSGLVTFGAKLQKDMRINAVSGFFLDLFLPIIDAGSGVLLINDLRPGNIWVSDQRGIEEETLSAMSRAYLSRDVQTKDMQGISAKDMPWKENEQVMLMGADGRRVGLLVLGKKCSQEEQELVRLFTEPLGAYIHNQLLMRKLEEKANTDALTGLYNRNYLEQALEEECNKLRKYNIPYAVVVADVNGLKKANDIFGHEAGDNLIVEVGRLLLEASRLTDVVTRTGGDEFLILLADSTTDNARGFIKRLEKQVFADASIAVGANDSFPVRVSLGAAGTDEFPPEKIIKEADRRMYEAKEKFYKSAEKYR